MTPFIQTNIDLLPKRNGETNLGTKAKVGPWARNGK